MNLTRIIKPRSKKLKLNTSAIRGNKSQLDFNPTHKGRLQDFPTKSDTQVELGSSKIGISNPMQED